VEINLEGLKDAGYAARIKAKVDKLRTQLG
jgi:formiminotetrahydrofolate cyclodeaminase